ncbi:MAG: hypothetical protein MUF22_05830 [Chitinispirillaceae bacterium]|nr:hypothetical protein [Chitinispirillaceae bacterium]
MSNELLKVLPDSVAWQDYRAANTGMVVLYASDPISEMPIREVPEELASEIQPEPHYESGTYGLYGCGKSKIRSAFVKSKIRYLLFITKYAGTRAEFKDKLVVTGYYRIFKTADAKKLHIRYGTDYSCIDEQVCYALRSDERRFVSIDDAFPVTDAILASWNFKARFTRQTRVILDEQHTLEVIEYLKSKKDITPAYVEETKRLQPHDDEGEAEEFEDFKPEE